MLDGRNPAIMPTKDPNRVDSAAIVLLSFDYISLFHVEHMAARHQVRNLGLEGRYPELRGHVPHQRHQPRKVLTIKFRGRIVEEQGRSSRPLGLLNLQLRQHEGRRDELLLPAGHTILRGTISDMD